MAKRKSERKAYPEVLKLRITQLQKRAKGDGVDADAMLISNAKDIRFLTGFVGDDSWAVVPMSGSKVVIISDSRYEEQILKDAGHVQCVMREKSLSEALKGVMEKRAFEKICVQPEYMTLGTRKGIAKKVGSRNIVEYDEKLIEQRAVKTAKEVKLIEKAAVIQQCAFNQTIAEIKPGMSEYEIAGLLEYKMRSLGADGPSFDTIIAADANASLPHAIPGKTKVKDGGIVLIDWGAKYKGYCADMTRVIALGTMKKKIAEIYQIVLDAQLAAIEAIKPGVRMKDVDKVARDMITNAGYGKEFGHGLGHGIGLDIHEKPVLSPLSEGVLEEGHVVTVEPGIYLPGIGGVRIEDDILVTGKGHKVLCDLPKSLESAFI